MAYSIIMNSRIHLQCLLTFLLMFASEGPENFFRIVFLQTILSERKKNQVVVLSAVSVFYNLTDIIIASQNVLYLWLHVT